MSYKEKKLSINERVKDLLSKMTTEEKAYQLTSSWSYDFTDYDFTFDCEKLLKMFPHGLGQMTRLGGALPIRPKDLPALYNKIQKYYIENTRLGIPIMFHEESCSGAMFQGTTNFPQAIGVASTFNTDLCEEMADIIGKELKYAGAHETLAPLLDVTREPRWGRTEETFGEDPYLVSQMGMAYIRGIQKNNILATGKHFVAYGAAEKGFNWSPGQVPERAMREVYLAPFEAAIKETNLGAIMPAYQENDGEPCHSSKNLLKTILRDEWGFNGLVVTDYSGLVLLESFHKLFPDYASIAKRAIECEIDVELPSHAVYGKVLADEVEKGTIDTALFEKVVSRVLSKKFELGLFDNPYIDEKPSFDIRNSESQKISLEVSRQSIILLKNDGILPLEKSKKIALIGPNAHLARNHLGDYAYNAHLEHMVNSFAAVEQGRNEGGVDFTNNEKQKRNSKKFGEFVKDYDATSIFEEITNKKVSVSYEQGCHIFTRDQNLFDKAVNLAKNSDVIVAVLGDKSGLDETASSGESRDRCDLTLLPPQEELLQALCGLGKPVILMLVHGRPVTLPRLEEKINAIVATWLPGEKGGEAIADVLFGDYNPGGKLPITFPRHVGQLPIYYGHKPSAGAKRMWGGYSDGSHEPLYPFGFGLSYTHFELSDFAVEKEQLSCKDSIKITCSIKNIGKREGDEVIQVYFRNNAQGVTRPVKELKAFKRVSLVANEKKSLSFEVPINMLGFYDEDMQFSLKKAPIDIMIGTSAENILWTKQIQLIDSAIINKKDFTSKVCEL
ncbi:MAG: glycoside hydrolase family 3 N-terminal domain-containing protein [Treponemataceae bacterium]